MFSPFWRLFWRHTVLATWRTPEGWLKRRWTCIDWLPTNLWRGRHFLTVRSWLVTDISYRLAGYSRFQSSRLTHMLTKYRNVPVSETSCFGVRRLYRNLTLQQKEFCLESIFLVYHIVSCNDNHKLIYELSFSCGKTREPLKLKFRWGRAYGTPCID